MCIAAISRKTILSAILFETIDADEIISPPSSGELRRGGEAEHMKQRLMATRRPQEARRLWNNLVAPTVGHFGKWKSLGTRPPIRASRIAYRHQASSAILSDEG